MLSLRRATHSGQMPSWPGFDFYPRSPCGERHRARDYTSPQTCISIHALLAESDQAANQANPRTQQISIHALLAESDLVHAVVQYRDYKFLSTLSLRRATLGRGQGVQCRVISIHALLAESDAIRSNIRAPSLISIHALLAESDYITDNSNRHSEYFYPRSPCGERPNGFGGNTLPSHFYPRSPCGERQCARGPLRARAPISIHALLAESDGRVLQDITPAGISIHALLAESDPIFLFIFIAFGLFLSTLSLRRATGDLVHVNALDGISIHALLAESDLSNNSRHYCCLYFYPRSPCGERLIA